MVKQLKDTINVRVQNNTSLPQNVNLLGSTSDPLAIPPSLLYQWDLSSESFFGSVTASIVISSTLNPTPVTHTVQVNGYNVSSVVFALNTLNMGVFQYNGNVIYISNDFYIYGALQIGTTVFTSVWNTNNTSVGSSASNQVTLPLQSIGSYDFVVDWGDGSQDTITSWNQAETTHTYSSIGTYNISIFGLFKGICFNGTGDRLKILSISNWGDLQLTGNVGFYFKECTNLDLTSVTGVLNIGDCTNLQGMFYNYSFSTINNIGLWDVSLITDFSEMFYSAGNFNQNINSWNTSSALNMNAMFAFATVFNQPLSNWNLSNVTNTSVMFFQANAFNQDISSWNVGSVTNMGAMFQNATAFNQNIGGWDVSNATNMSSMFRSAVNFNQNIGSWTVSGVTNMSTMFRGATAFNQDIGGWNVSNVIDMSYMFSDATAFNQDIGAWDISNVSDFSDFMFAKTPATYSLANLDSIYFFWSQLSVQPNINISFGTAKYTVAGSAGRLILTSAPNNWVITDGGI